jgi:hypothetical protein
MKKHIMKGQKMHEQKMRTHNKQEPNMTNAK